MTAPHLELITSLLDALGAERRPTGEAEMSAVELDAALPPTLRAVLVEWGEGALGLEPLERARAASPALDVRFPYGDAEAREALRPGEYVFLEAPPPGGTWLLAVEEGTSTVLVVCGEQRDHVWAVTPYGVAPLYFMRDDAPVQHTFDTWYEQVLRARAGEGSPSEDSAPTREEPAPDPSALPRGDEGLLRKTLEDAREGVVVAWPRGRYELDAPLHIDRGVIVDGAGEVELVAPVGAAALEVVGGRAAIRGCAISALRPDEPAAGRVGVRVSRAASLHLHGVRLQGCALGVEARDDAAVVVTGCELLSLETGIFARDSARLALEDSLIVAGDLALRVAGSATVEVSACQITHSVTAMEVEETGELTAVGCRLDQIADSGLRVTGGRASVRDSTISVTGGCGAQLTGGTTRMIGTAIPYARMSCVAVDRGASALLEHNLFGAANYGVHVVGSKARDAAVVRGNVVRGSLDGIFVEGRAEVLDNHATGARQFGIHVRGDACAPRGNEAYRNGHSGLSMAGDPLADNHAFDNEWESGRRPARASRPIPPSDAAGAAPFACALSGLFCAGPTRVFVIDRAAPTVALTLPVLVTFAGGELVRAELRPESEDLLVWLDLRRRELSEALRTLLGEGLVARGRHLGAVLVDDACFLALATADEAKRVDLGLDSIVDLEPLFAAAFDDPTLAREILRAASAGDAVLLARLRAQAAFRRSGGLAGGLADRRGVLVDAALAGRAELPEPAPAPEARSRAFPDDARLASLRGRAVPTRAAASPEASQRERVGGLELPEGEWLTPRGALPGHPGAPPGIWLAARPEQEAGFIAHALAATHADHGLWPLVLEDDLEIEPAALRARPADALAAERFLKERWTDIVAAREEQGLGLALLRPFDASPPKMAPASAPRRSPAAEPATRRLEGRLALVACPRPADALAALGWAGCANHFDDIDALVEVLASWQSRFGATLAMIEQATLTFVVARPPVTRKAALALAAEHYAVCPDIVEQHSGTLRKHAESLVALPCWTLWWD
ncbi:MAG: DUF4253 domain-containing protein [Polyangiaceae bacterium]|jgi:hypothetical protein|nr:DUF4253 domain-containing protein [Polyangiaceae bacterium]